MPNIFVKIAGIKGESTIDGHKDEIEVLEFESGAEQPTSGTKSSAGGGSTSSVKFNDIKIKKYVDSSTPLLYKFCASGNHIDTVEFAFHRAAKDGATVKYMEVKLVNTIISKISTEGKGDDDIPVETVQFNFGQMEMTYVPQARAQGAGGGNIPFKIDLEKLKIS